MTDPKGVIHILYYANRISANLARSEEGYLICRGVPVARTGTQTYFPAELGLPGTEPVSVLRPEEEVFSPACLASFEGKPVTEDHPDDPEGVGTENIRQLQRGHAQNLRRGTGEESCFLLADLIITDPETVRHVLDGKREISCGYTYLLSREGDGYVQREIRGNHIAIVDKGRAGPRVAIRDSRPSETRTVRNERRNNPMKPEMKANIRKLVSVALKANDLEPDELQGVMSLMQAVSEEPAENKPEVEILLPADPAAEEASSVITVDEDLSAKLDRIIELLTVLTAPAATDEDPLEEAVEQLLTEAEEVEEIAAEAEPDPEDFLVTEEDEDQNGETRTEACDRMVRAAVRAMKPIIANLPADRKRAAADAALRAIRSNMHSGKPVTYAALRSPRRTTDGSDPRALGRRIMASRNANRAR